jgi:sugar-specific transcriptional regulator TrmB
MPKLKEDYIQTADFLKEELSKVQIKNNLEQTFNLKGEESIYDKVRELILKAKKEIYLNTNINLETFKDAIDEAVKNNVRIILFSFEKHVNYTLNIEVYNKTETPISNGNRKRIMLVVDMEDTLVANSKFSEFSGIYTRNELMVEIIAEHVHNDIYLTELEKTYEEGFWDKISLNTMKENKI